ncbi:hypothetical protein Tco_0948047 [Tanacetum coccineum]
MVDPVIDELAEPIVEVEEQMVAPTMDIEKDLAVLFGDDDFSDDGLDDDEDEEKVWEMDEEWLMAPVTPPLMPVMLLPSTYRVGGPSTTTPEGHSLTLLEPRVPVPPSMIEDLCTRMGNLEYGLRQLVKKVSDAEVADSISIREIGPRVSTMEGQMQVLASQKIQVVSGLEQGQQAATQRNEIITGLSRQTYPNVVGKMVRWLDDEIPRNRIPTLRMDLLGVARFPRWVEAKVVNFEVESEKWRRLLLHQMCVAIDIATDGREEDFLPQNGK